MVIPVDETGSGRSSADSSQLNKRMQIISPGKLTHTHKHIACSHGDRFASWHASHWATVDDWVLHLALVVAPLDLEVTAEAGPVLIPGIGHQPVRSALFLAPAQDLDGVSSQHRISDWVGAVEHSRLVRLKALVHDELGADRTILVDLLHHVIS